MQNKLHISGQICEVFFTQSIFSFLKIGSNIIMYIKNHYDQIQRIFIKILVYLLNQRLLNQVK